MVMAPKNKKMVSNYIPDDLFFSILSNLPLKSLKRFTFVCKSWSHLFENPNFMNMFRKNLISAHRSLYDDTCVLLKELVSNPREYYSRLHLLYGDRFENKVQLETPLQFQGKDFDISDCANGIFALFFNEKGILWNPSSQECIDIPLSPPQFIPLTVANRIIYFQGFGYDLIRDDYKVIRCVGIYPETDGKVQLGTYWTYKPLRSTSIWEIFSLRSNSWRELEGDFPHPSYSYFTNSQVYFNGMCHWLGGTSWLVGTLNELPVVNCVVSFNLTSEMFITTPLLFDTPDGDNSELPKRPKRNLVVLNGSIAMISKYSTAASFHISILGEPGFEGSWVKLFIVGPLPFIKEPIGAGKNSQIFFRTKDDDLVCFDLNTQKFEEVGLKGMVSCQTSIYKRNLFPIIRV